ncbi:MAG: undecaprenyldiphospho-muramoylpentapeptide beta-N-acetylglucosaminyltransferase [Oscillospiraceae bacterium]|nr:undecaprenyldiphospho-muramoylpentapeptide beta-N-acetylglucosaminyltransferase [Oscillospiraceae bacterium]
MRVIITGGGTAGHINPALAIANFIKTKEPDSKIIYVGNPDHMEYKLATKAGFEFVGIKVKGFQRKINFRNILNNIEAIGLLITSSQRSKKILKDFKPDLVIGTGGYVTGPIIKTAAQLGIKTLTHEQNAYPGITTRLLSKKVDRVLLAVKEASRYLSRGSKIEITGNPIRKEILFTDRDKAREKLGISKNSICILSFGGSLGARTINKSVASLISKTYKNNNLYYIHSTGKFGFEEFLSLLNKQDINIKNFSNINIKEYIDNMDECLAAADIVICRAGAITLSELQAVGRACILIPSPNVAENHQYHNAKVLADNNAAILIQEKDLTDQKLYQEVINLVSNNINILRMQQNIKKMAVTDACDKIYNIIKQI